MVLYGAGLRGAIAVRLKNQLNENAKACAFAGAVPEVAHNEVLAWTGAARAGTELSLILLRDPADSAGDAELLSSFGDLLESAETLEWSGPAGEDEISRAFALLAYGDLVSCALADVEGVDAFEIDRLGELKRRLASARAVLA